MWSDNGGCTMPTAGSSGPPRAFLYALLAVSLLFVAAGIGMILSGADGGVTATAFFGACAAVFVWQLRPDLFETETRTPEALLAGYPGPVVLRASPRKHLLLAAASAVFGGAVLGMLRHEAVPVAMQVLLWPGVILFLGGAPLLVLVAVRGSSLRLDADGLVIAQAWRSHRVRWRDASGFHATTVAGTLQRLVVFDDAAAGASRMAAMNRGLTGRSSGLPDTYGLTPEELAVLLTAWCAQARRGTVPGA